MSQQTESTDTQQGAHQSHPTSKKTSFKRVKSTKLCDVCGRGFLKLAHLIRHVRTHGDERPFSCGNCEKAFARADALQRHERAVHASRDAQDANELEPSFPAVAVEGNHAAPEEQICKKRKTGTLPSGQQTPGSETASMPKSRGAGNSNMHPDYTQLFGLDRMQTSQQLQRQEQPCSMSASFPIGGNSLGGQAPYSGHIAPSALGVPGSAPQQGLINAGDVPDTASHSVPVASHMASFPPPYLSAASLDASIDSWLTLEGGSYAAENALEMVFSSEPGGPTHQWDNSVMGLQPSNAFTSAAFNAASASASASAVPLSFSTPSAGNGSIDNGFNKLYPFGLQFEDLWKSGSQADDYAFEPAGMNASTREGAAVRQKAGSSKAFEYPFAGVSNTLDSPAGGFSASSFGTTVQQPPSASSPPTISANTSAVRDDQTDSTSAKPKRKVFHRSLTTDTWLNAMQVPEDGNVDLPRQDITSPEQIMGELTVETSVDKMTHRLWVKEEQTAIPSMKFLDSCLHLYFRDFHPTFPILHKPTFSRHQSPPLLLLSMCSIGCIFMGTQAAREKGLWIYERLHHVIVFSRDSKMATEDARVAMTLSGLLGQCFSFLYGEPKHMFTAESFHGCLCTFARRAGLFKLIDRNNITYDNVADLDDEALEARWRAWARREMLRRVALGLTLHAADAATYSLLPRLVPVQLSATDQSSDALFEAEDASTWKWLLLCLNGGSPNNALRTPPSTGFQVIPTVDTLFPMSVMAQKIVNILHMKELCKSETSFVLSFRDTRLFYCDMLQLGARFGISHEPHRGTGNARVVCGSSHQQQILKVMWHYCCLARLARLDQIEEVAGREGIPQQDVLEQVKAWVTTPEARLATLHCAHVLHNAADLRDLAFIVPRAIFQSTLVLLCFIAFNESPSGSMQIFDATDATDWEHFAEVVADCSKPGAAAESTLDTCANSGFEYVIDGRPRLAERWIRSNCCRWKLDKFIEGKEKQMDYVSLLSTTTRLLRRCTPWKIGDAMGDILATINLGC